MRADTRGDQGMKDVWDNGMETSICGGIFCVGCYIFVFDGVFGDIGYCCEFFSVFTLGGEGRSFNMDRLARYPLFIHFVWIPFNPSPVSVLERNGHLRRLIIVGTVIRLHIIMSH